MSATGYHCSAKTVSFGKGQSAVHTAAYNAREQLEHEREGRTTKDYGKTHSAALFTGIFAPENAPEWAHDRGQLWNRAEAAERHMHGQPARNMTVAFPHELNQQQREWLIKDFAREQFARKGMVADVAIHAPDKEGDQRNFHAHILMTMRKIEGQEFARTKAREWNSKEQLATWREAWAEKGANVLHRAGYEVEAERWRHGHKTLAEQREAALSRGDKAFVEGLAAEATIHKGAKTTAAERRGASTERLERFREVVERNDIRVEIKALEAGRAGTEPTKEPHQPAEERPKAAESGKTAPEAAATPKPAQEAPTASKGRPEKVLKVNPVKSAGGLLGAIGASLLRGLMGESSSSPEAAAKAPEAEPPHVREEAERAQKMQEILRQSSRVVPPSAQKDHEIEQAKKARDDRDGRERER